MVGTAAILEQIMESKKQPGGANTTCWTPTGVPVSHARLTKNKDVGKAHGCGRPCTGRRRCRPPVLAGSADQAAVWWRTPAY